MILKNEITELMISLQYQQYQEILKLRSLSTNDMTYESQLAFFCQCSIMSKFYIELLSFNLSRHKFISFIFSFMLSECFNVSSKKSLSTEFINFINLQTFDIK